MIIRCHRVDQYVFDAYFHSSRVAIEWIEEAKQRAPWLDRALLADFFLCFFLENPEIDETKEVPLFHRWMVRHLLKQYFYHSIHPRTVNQEAAAFKTAVKALMWLSESFAEEAAKRETERAQNTIGLQGKKGGQGEESFGITEHLSKAQLEKLQLVGYTLQYGKRSIEEREQKSDTKPLVEAEIRALRERIQEAQEEMKTQFTKRGKLQQKLKKLKEELAQREKQQERLSRQEREALAAIESELGGWLNQSLQAALGEQDDETLLVDELLRASQRIANRRWGTELGKLRRQAYEQYLLWVNKLKRNPELIAFLEDVGRSVQQFRVKRREIRSRNIPEEYVDLRQSNDVSHMLPSEAVLLADPDLETYFSLKWVEQKLFTYDACGWIEEPPRGPVICMLDTSHSMRGGKLRLAQVFVMTFAALCLMERRDFYLLLFGAKGELVEQPLYHRRPDWEAFYALARMAFGGGTHFDAPMKRGIQIVEQNPAFHGADLVMVTDGIGAISPYVQAMLADAGGRKQLKLHTLLIGSARQHLVSRYDIYGVSHRIRFAASWESAGEEQTGLLLDVFG
ncbi:hypothetical protein [Brevibacillus massiliensis]|uniref:hypothetical protein n=1 Tax=Brevibacillus massiliensis TaxID=1118054 RepID=UPI0002FE47D2|nr:hypothetical protein [Brevibacillus massiliensis]